MTLEILTSEILRPVAHGFFTRRGGASSGIFSGLNCGIGSSDQAEVVAINRGRVASAMGVESHELVTVAQVHSACAVQIDAVPTSRPKADGLVTAKEGIALAILTADCVPVLFADSKNRVIGAAHAGWRGAFDGVLEATVDAMVDLGAEKSSIAGALGPSISQRAYEVGPEFVERFVDADPENSRFFCAGANGRDHFDLPAYVIQRLRTHGLDKVEWIRHCTYHDPDKFYSYRRSFHLGEADYGRLISAIRI
ncbi:MAG: peptidoglycan editing factor PgeF [Pseudomonadota bacterium]